MTSQKYAHFYLSGAESIAFAVLVVVMNFGWHTPIFGTPGDRGGVASMTTSQALLIVVGFGILHHIVQALYNSNREDPTKLSRGELWWDIITSVLPFITGLICFPLGWGADWWFWFKLTMLGIVFLASMDDVLPTCGSLKAIWSR